MLFGKSTGWYSTLTVLTSGSGSAPTTVRVMLNVHTSSWVSSLQPAAVAGTRRSPITLSLMVASVRFGLSAEDLFVIVNVYVTGSVTFESPSPVLSIWTAGWKRLTS